MRYDDDKTQDGSGTPPDEPAGWSTAAGSEAEAAAGGQSGGDSAGPAESATEAPAVPAPTSAPLPTQPSPWPPQPIDVERFRREPVGATTGRAEPVAGTAATARSTGVAGAAATARSTGVATQPRLAAGPELATPAGWQPYPPPRPFGYPSQPPAGDVGLAPPQPASAVPRRHRCMPDRVLRGDGHRPLRLSEHHIRTGSPGLPRPPAARIRTTPCTSKRCRS